VIFVVFYLPGVRTQRRSRRNRSGTEIDHHSLPLFVACTAVAFAVAFLLASRLPAAAHCTRLASTISLYLAVSRCISIRSSETAIGWPARPAAVMNSLPSARPARKPAPQSADPSWSRKCLGSRVDAEGLKVGTLAFGPLNQAIEVDVR
jgi:hypothetical protein